MMSLLVEGSPETAAFIEQITPFLAYLKEWERTLPTLSLQELAPQAQSGQVGVFCIDIINGFCHQGPLSSPRVQALIPPIVKLFEQMHGLGVRDFVLAQDTHSQNAVEFRNFAPHCQEGTVESQTVPELAALPFAGIFHIVRKNSLSMVIETDLSPWLAERPHLRDLIVIGDCTDLCIYQAAMHLKLTANARNAETRIIVPANCVQTYDLPVATAKKLHILPHDGDLLQLVFLYHLFLNGVTVLREVKG